MIEIKKLNISIDNHEILKDINMNWQDNDLIGVVGLNGAGKSSLFKSILQMGFFKNDSITYYNDINIKQDIGYLNESRGMFSKESVINNLIFFAKLNLLSKNESTKRINFWIDFFKMQNILNKKMYDISKGNQQKVQFISSILGEPKYLILDEPFSGIDPLNADLFIKAIKYLNQKGIAILYSSHQMEYVNEISDKIIFIKAGEIVADGYINNIVSDYYNISNYQSNSDINILQRELLDKNLVKNVFPKNSHELITTKVDPKLISKDFKIESADLNDIFKFINSEEI